jgi:hypothetical protein
VKKNFSIRFSIKQRGADLDDPRKVETINLSWFLTEAAIKYVLPFSIAEFFRKIPKEKSDNFSGRMMTVVMQSSAHLKSDEQAWLLVAEAAARPGIRDIGLELTPRSGLSMAEGGFELISQLQEAGWQPVSFKVSEKSKTEQRIVDQRESLKKIVFTLSFARIKPSQKPIEIPSAVLEVLAKQVTWGFVHVWYNRAILHSVNVNYTIVYWKKNKQERLPPQWVVTL